jgi:hypothetical protein
MADLVTSVGYAYDRPNEREIEVRSIIRYDRLELPANRIPYDAIVSVDRLERRRRVRVKSASTTSNERGSKRAA